MLLNHLTNYVSIHTDHPVWVSFVPGVVTIAGETNRPDRWHWEGGRLYMLVGEKVGRLYLGNNGHNNNVKVFCMHGD